MAGLFDSLNGMVMNPMFMGGLGLLSGGGGQGAMQGMQQGLLAQRQMQADQEQQQRKAAYQQAVQQGLLKDLPGNIGGLASLMTPDQAIGLVGDFGKAKYGSDLNVSEKKQIMPMELAQRMAIMRAQGSQELANKQAMIGWQAQNDPMYKAQLSQLQQKDEMGGLLSDAMRRAMGGTQGAPQGGIQGGTQMPMGAPQPQGLLQRNSFDAPGFDPANVMKTQAAPQPTAPTQPAEGMVDTPLGPMSKNSAATLGFGFAAKGMGEAGKMLFESANGAMLSKEARNELDKKEINTTELVGRLKSIESGFKPEYQTLEHQAKMYGVSWMDSFDTLRKKVPPQQLAQLSDYTAHKQNTLANLNQTIKDITGAAMTDGEAKRIMATAPNMNDSPTQFQTKMQALSRQAQLSIVRYRYMRQNGFQGDINAAAGQMPLEKMQKIINDRASGMYRDLKGQNPNANEQQIKDAVRSQLKAEFGVDA